MQRKKVIPLRKSAARRALVFAPHPDDDVLGCGGTLAGLASLGADIRVVYLTSGENGDASTPPPRLGILREAEAARAARVLGIRETIFWRQPDGGLTSSAQLIERAVALMRAFQPHLAFFPHARDAHGDHRAAHDIARESLRAASGPWHPRAGRTPWTVPAAFAYEVWTPMEEYAVAQDVTRFMTRKMQALAAHKSQLKNVDYAGAVRGLARYRAVTSGAGEYCECFQVLRAEGII